MCVCFFFGKFPHAGGVPRNKKIRKEEKKKKEKERKREKKRGIKERKKEKKKRERNECLI